MAKKKTTKVVEPVEEVKVEEVEEVIESEEKAQEVLSKEKICEFYGIRDEELLSPEKDLSKYNLSKQEEEALLEWACKNKKVKSEDVVFDMYTTNLEAWAIIAKYGITPKDVAEGKMDELTEKEKDIIVAYYNDLVSKL